MKYYAIGSATIKVDDKMTLEEVKKMAISKKLIEKGSESTVREITQQEFVAPLEEKTPSWEEIIDELRRNSVSHQRGGRRKKK